MKRLILFLICMALAMGLSWLLSINPAKEYGWFMGFIHGGFFVPNWIISLFDHDWLFKAPVHTTMYNIDWWISAVTSACGWILNCIGVILSIFKRK